MAATFDRELRQILEKADCHHVRSGKGSHEIWYSPITKRNFPVPRGIVSRHTANGVLHDAGLQKNF
jgi:HicA-like toxin of HicAB toxin-antitoxin system